MLACARIGVIHSVVYSGFSAPALQAAFRMPNASWSLRPTSGLTGERSSTSSRWSTKPSPTAPTVERVVVLRRQTPGVSLVRAEGNRLAGLAEGREGESGEAEQLDAEHPLYILYALRHYRQTQRRGPCPRRLHGRDLHHHEIRLRSQRGRCTTSVSQTRAGSPATVILCMVPFSTEPQSLQLKASRTTRTRAAGGI